MYLTGWEERQHHSLVLRKLDRPPPPSRLGFRVRTDHDLDLLADWYARRAAGPCGWATPTLRGMTGGRCGCGTTSAPRWSSTSRWSCCASVLQDYHLHRGAPIMRFDHVNLHSSQLEEALVHWQQLGFRCSEYISTDSRPPTR